MKSESKTVADALLADVAVAAIAGGKIYQEEAPAMAAFPRVVFAEAQSPAASADNAVVACTVTFDMEALAAPSAWPLAEAVILCMKKCGYVCNMAQSAGVTGPDGTIHQVSMKFTTIKEVLTMAKIGVSGLRYALLTADTAAASPTERRRYCPGLRRWTSKPAKTRRRCTLTTVRMKSARRWEITVELELADLTLEQRGASRPFHRRRRDELSGQRCCALCGAAAKGSKATVKSAGSGCSKGSSANRTTPTNPGKQN